MQPGNAQQVLGSLPMVGLHEHYQQTSYGLTMPAMNSLLLPYALPAAGHMAGHPMAAGLGAMPALSPEAVAGYAAMPMIPAMAGAELSLSQFEREAAALAEGLDNLNLNPRAKEFVPPSLQALKAWPMFPAMNTIPAHYLPRDAHGMPLAMPMLAPPLGTGLPNMPGQLPMPGLHPPRNASQASAQGRASSDRGDRAGGSGSGSGGARGGRQRGQKKKTVQQGLEENVQRTIYICDIDQQVTEEQLANVFQDCGAVIDCRVCGDPNSAMRFAFIEFTAKEAAAKAISKTGTVLGAYPLRVLPSKTAIVPVNNEFLPRTAEEREQCSRTVYAANICRKVDKADVQRFFATLCGPVSRIRLLGDSHHNTRIAFVEFQQAESAKAALNCSGALLGSLPIRVSPSKTPVRADPRDSEQ